MTEMTITTTTTAIGLLKYTGTRRARIARNQTNVVTNNVLILI